MPADVSDPGHDALAAVMPCPACKAPPPHPEHLAFAAFGHPYHLHRCTACTARFFVPEPVADYTEHTDSLNAVRHYVEFDANISNMLRMLGPALAAKPGGHLLDIGCGFGFSADLARHAFGWEVQGVEPSAYGRMGGAALGVPMLDRFLDFNDPFDGRRFDVVHCSEVIEHISDPAAFLALLRHYLAEGGTIVLSTPLAEAIDNPAIPFTRKLALLSAGSHVAVFTETAMTRMLHAAGFAHVSITLMNDTMVAYASDAPLQIAPVPDVTGTLIRYLSDRVGALPPGMARLGFATRLFLELVHTGRYQEARQTWQTAGLSLPDAMPPVSDHDAYMAALPTGASLLAYCRGMLALNFEQDPARAATLFQLAADAAAAKMRVAPASASPDHGVYWHARFHHALALGTAGDATAARAAARAILAHEPAERLADFGPPDDATMKRARTLTGPEAPVVLAMRAQVNARPWARKLRHLVRRLLGSTS